MPKIAYRAKIASHMYKYTHNIRYIEESINFNEHFILQIEI